jgi:polysaccharide export outer membrane protein
MCFGSLTEVYAPDPQSLATIDKVGMNSLLKTAATLLVVAALCAGQTASSDPPSTSAPSGTAGATPTSPPDLTFKPANNPPAPEPATPAPARPTQTTATPAPPPAAAAKAPAAPPAAAGKSGAASNVSSTYILGPNDVVQVTVFDEAHLPGTYVIGPDGEMSMPLIGAFRAVGLSLTELNELIAEKLKGFINDPVVNVQLLRNNSKQYTVMGAMNKTGPFPLLRQTTILDALAACGGFRDFASRKKIYLLRGAKRYYFNYDDVRQGKHMAQNIPIEDGDYIYVPGE